MFALCLPHVALNRLLEDKTHIEGPRERGASDTLCMVNKRLLTNQVRKHLAFTVSRGSRGRLRGSSTRTTRIGRRLFNRFRGTHMNTEREGYHVVFAKTKPEVRILGLVALKYPGRTYILVGALVRCHDIDHALHRTGINLSIQATKRGELGVCNLTTPCGGSAISTSRAISRTITTVYNTRAVGGPVLPPRVVVDKVSDVKGRADNVAL